MEEIQHSILLCKYRDSKEKFTVDKEGDIFYHVLSINSVSKSKEKLFALEIGVMDVMNVSKSFIVRFCRKKVTIFPSFSFGMQLFIHNQIESLSLLIGLKSSIELILGSLWNH